MGSNYMEKRGSDIISVGISYGSFRGFSITSSQHSTNKSA